MRKLTLILITMFGLGGCATTSSKPTITYYLLDQAQQPIVAENAIRSVAIDPVFVAEYLSLPNLVLKQDDHQIILANYHLWAEPLPPSIKRAIISDLSSIVPNVSIVDRCANCDLIKLYVDHFYPEQQGEAVFAGRYTIRRAGGIVQNHIFSLRAPLATDGYSAAVKQMRNLIQTLAQQIATEL